MTPTLTPTPAESIEERKAAIDEAIAHCRDIKATIHPIYEAALYDQWDKRIDTLLAEKDALTQRQEADRWADQEIDYELHYPDASPDTLAAGLEAAGFGSGGIF